MEQELIKSETLLEPRRLRTNRAASVSNKPLEPVAPPGAVAVRKKTSRWRQLRDAARLPLYAAHLALRALRFQKNLEPYPIYQQDGLISLHNCDFIQNQVFQAAYRDSVQKGMAVNNRIEWRAHVLCFFARSAINLNGCFVECGTNKGFMANTVIQYLRLLNLNVPRFYLMDTFEGLVESQITDLEWSLGHRGGGYAPAFDFVREKFAKSANVTIVRGVIPETLSKIDSKRVSLIHIDMNCVYPEIAAAEYFWDRLVPGGFMILDDYGHRPHYPQKKGFQDFANRKGTEILSLPTGQGLIIK